MDSGIARQERQPRALAVLMVACAGLVAVLCALGVYAAIAYDVARRRREIGVRVAMGASSRAVAKSVVVPNARALGLGIVIRGGAAAPCAEPSIGPLRNRGL